MRSNALISRRTCLRGMGVALALPLMETMGWADVAEGAAYRPPVRLGFMYMPHGVIMERFWPGDPATFLSAPPPNLEPLKPVLDQCLLVKGITGVPISPLNGVCEISDCGAAMSCSASPRRSRTRCRSSSDAIRR